MNYKIYCKVFVLPIILTLSGLSTFFFMFDSTMISRQQDTITIPQEHQTITKNDALIHLDNDTEEHNNRSINIAFITTPLAVSDTKLDTPNNKTKQSYANKNFKQSPIEQPTAHSILHPYLERNTYAIEVKKQHQYNVNQKINMPKWIILSQPIAIYETPNTNGIILYTALKGEKVQLIAQHNAALCYLSKNPLINSVWNLVRYKNQKNEYIHGYTLQSSLEYAL
ncbi:hypothetical protein CQA66_07580 [Helicobacter aurati]|uniref:SH3 domain-containing protein n=1 Tax=Helicobacter aurati TaxID=137778 RepID=A0A3D8J0Y2_9HELI|nr:hypothetical protein [Helicobacter aurati]RDU70866.1 hypothetical protein CQA66_07580 [Helicobacter aurati]